MSNKIPENERGRVTITWEREIHDKDRLVPSNFHYGSKEIADDCVKGIDMVDAEGNRYNEYPQNGLRLSHARFRAMARTELLAFLIGTPGNRPSYFLDHPGRYIAPGMLHPQAEDIQALQPTDPIPLHPYIEDLATRSKRGFFSGAGYYWRLGANQTFDPIIIRLTKNGKAKLLVVEGTDKRGWVLPGGEKEDGEDGLSGAAREAGEETGINLQGRPAFLVRRGIPVGDWRATANAWPETIVYLYVIDEREGKKNNQKLKPQEGETLKVAWKDMTEKDISTLGFSHPNLVRLAVLELEKQMGVIIDKKGRLGKAKETTRQKL